MRGLREHRAAICVLFGVIALRLVSFGYLAISDPTESRYAEIAKHMFESRDWVTPRLYVHGELVPYWGKPPLHFWLTSYSYQLFGVSEWSSRLPSILGGFTILITTFFFARYLRNLRIAFLSTLILASSGLFFVLWGASAIDVTLSAAMTISMVTFSMAIIGKTKKSRWLWGILFFASLAMGTLAKGLEAPAIAAFSIALWWLTSIKRQSLRHIPWISGSFIYLLITVPWYLNAESRTPGFLQYFFLNEHLLRFIKHDYGDKYGTGHMYPRGTIWGMLILTYLPWTFLLIRAAYSHFKKGDLFHRFRHSEEWLRYLLIWGIAPALFFTFSRQLLATYLLPGFAGLAVVTAVVISNRMNPITRNRQRRILYASALIVPVIIAFATFTFGGVLDQNNSVKPLFAELAANHPEKDLFLIFPFFEPASANFYESSYKPISIIHTNQPIEKQPDDQADTLFILKVKQQKNLPAAIQNRTTLLRTRGEWAIYEQANHGSDRNQ